MDLDAHLIAKTSPKARQTQIFICDDVRITVLTDRLLRVENGKKFNDDATQMVFFRDLGEYFFRTEKNKDSIHIITESTTFIFNTKSKKITFVIINDKQIKVSNRGNLRGTARTLDMTFGAIHLHKGIMSKTGIAVLDDKSLLLKSDGMVSTRDDLGTDKYIFAYGNVYRKALFDFFRLTGECPMIPRFALGNWWSRYRAYTEREYVNLMQKFIDFDIPISVATIDMDWHWVDIKTKFDWQIKSKNPFQTAGWTGYSWNTDLFPDYKQFLNGLKSNGFKTTVNLHPASGIRSFEDMYPAMASTMGVKDGENVAFDLTDNKFVKAYFDIIHHPYEENGVDFWWIDWQQGKKTSIKGLDPLWLLNHYHYLDNARDNKRPLILSRYAGFGSHRYPLGFSGDTAISWSVLKFQPYFTATASNAGYTWWSHDIGGHHFGRRSDEMYLRWLQLGIFSPINRLHSTSSDLLGKEPWTYSSEVCHLAKEWLRLRHQLIPYIYNASYLTNKYGIALVEPMYYQYPDSESAYNSLRQFMFGTELIVAPIVEKRDKNILMSKAKVWIPKGRFTDIFTRTIYNGDKWVEMYRDLDTIPVLAKEGAIIPLAIRESNSTENPKKLDIYVYRGNGNYSMFEDNGIDNSYKNGIFCITDFNVCEKSDRLIFKMFAPNGDISVLPIGRDIKIRFRDILQAEEVEVFAEKTRVDFTKADKEEVCIEIKNIDYSQDYTVTLINPIARENESIYERASYIFSRYQTSNWRKSRKYLRLKNSKTLEEFKSKLSFIRLPASVIGAINELL